MIRNSRGFTTELVLAIGLATLLIILSLAVSEGATDAFDLFVRNGVHQSSSPALTASMEIATRFGSATVLTLLFSACFLYLYLTGRRASAWNLAVTMAAAIVFENGLKEIVHRARPEPFFSIAAPETYGFPSGHALFSTCFYGKAAWILRERVTNTLTRAAYWAIAGAIVVGIAYSRVYLGVHYPTDVVGGILTAAFLLCAVHAGEQITSNR
jgi:membrane-associated phospholipid phosphatase